MEHLTRSFDKTIQDVETLTKFNMVKILEKYKIFPKMMNVPLCQMVPMLVVCPTFNIDIMKMEHAFQMAYKEGDKVFYLSSTNWKGEENTIDEHEQLWNVQWWEENKRINFYGESKPP
jgi:hypothetical protein